ncbi:MAG: 30S ribosomal protein S1, partial [Victivallales bacterium]|nr:30S ribosomal protein S1 [Victivallales bacterium]
MTTETKNVEEMSDFLDLSSIKPMEELLQEKEQAEFIAGTIVEGTIIEKRDNGTLVDIGYKAEGFLNSEEFDNWADVKVGDKIDVFLDEIENSNSMPGISAKKAIFQKAWSTIITDYKEGSVVKGVMKSRIRGGVMVDVMGIEAFLPGSQVDVTPVRNLDDYMNKEYDFKILKINHERRNIVVSRRELLEEDMAEKRAAIMSSIEVGQLRKGIVKNITDFGAFIDLGGMDGLLHITDMSWGRISHPSEMIEVAQEMEVVILAIDTDRGRISLGLKQKSDNPWSVVEDRYPIGSKVTGHIVNLMPYGAFMEIEQGIEGLIHVSEMSWTKRITKASDVLKAGDEVEAIVLDVRKDQKKISLGLRQTDRNPWEALAEKYPKGTKIVGKVRNMTSYGAFVEIENDIDGMIHISDMSWTRKINNPNEILKPGDEVEAVILDIDSEQQRISLGMKQAETDPWAEIEKLYKIGDKVTGHIAKITAFGAFVELSHKIDGLIHISQISKDRVERVKDVLKLNDEVEARVIKIDAAERRIGLSVRALDEDFSEAEIKKVADEVSKEIDGAMVGMGEAFDDALSVLEENVKKKDASKKPEEKK